jgi:hypothetical protein
MMRLLCRTSSLTRVFLPRIQLVCRECKSQQCQADDTALCAYRRTDDHC